MRLMRFYLLRCIGERNGRKRDLMALSDSIQGSRHLFFAARLNMRRLTTTFLRSYIR